MFDAKYANLKIAVLLPCYNEGAAIRKVVEDFRAVLPESDIYVYDNNSSDNTISEAMATDAIVRQEPLQGKGNVVRRMFADVDADIYIMADGDGTYDTKAAVRLIDELVDNNLDMVVGTRVEAESDSHQYRPGHRFGNSMLTSVVSHLFGDQLQDVLSGYRVMSRRFVKSFPGLAKGFEIEVMLTIHALSLRLPVAEVGTDYFDRAEGTESKLNTIRDGIRILFTILYLFKEVYPLKFFGVFSVLFFICALFFGVPVIFEYFETGLVPRFPSAILATGFVMLAAISSTCGLVLDTVSRGQLELKKILYSSMSSVASVLKAKE